VDGYDAALKLLTKAKEREILRMLEAEAIKLLATGFKEPLELEIPIQISKKMLHSRGRFYFKESNDMEIVNGRLCIITEREAVVIRIAHSLIIGSILDNDYSTLLDTLRHEVVHYALYIMGEDAWDGSRAFESALTRLGITSSLQSDDTTAEYIIMDTYACMKHPEICGIATHSVKARGYCCQVCEERLERVNMGFYKYSIKS
jgi:hypothetical protein